MSKPRLLITVNGGIIQHIAANQEVEIVIVDHDNLRDETEETIKTLGEIQSEDLIMSKWDMEASISLIKHQYLKPKVLKRTTDKPLLGYQVVDKNNIPHPDMDASFCIYSLDQANEMILNSDDQKIWSLLSIYEGDIEEPTMMFE